MQRTLIQRKIQEVKIKIRAEQPADIAEISRVNEDAFKDALHSDQTEHLIVEALRKSGALTISLVAELEGEIVGHVAISPVSISDGSGNWYGLGPISVSPESQGKGVGTKLMNAALAELRVKSASGCVVLGEPEYYGRFGFKFTSRLLFPGVPAEYFQSLAFDSSSATGVVTYHDAFYGRV